VKNCGRRFHLLVTSKDFIQDLVKLIGPKNDPPAELQEKVLSLIQVWSDTFRGHPDLSGVVQVYNDLKLKKIEFPPTNYECWAPIHTPQRTVQVQGPRSNVAFNGPMPINPSVLPLNHVVPTTARLPVITTMQVPVTLPAISQAPIVLNEEQLSKVQAELQTVNGNCFVFDEMLIELEKSNETQPEDWDLLNELHATCQAMQKRIVEMIDRVANEEVTSELLRINDVLNSLFCRYASLISKRSNVSAGPEDHFGSAAGPDVTAVGAFVTASATQTVRPTTTTAAASTAEATLIDLGDTQTTSAVISQLDALTLGAAASAAPLTPKTASSSTLQPSIAAHSHDLAQAIGGDSAFDMFAQMRSDKKDRSEELINIPNEQEVNEMEKWLKAQPISAKPLEQSDFDRFLEERAVNLDRQPNVTQPNSNNARETKPKMLYDDPFGL
jgi:hypothetical protein